MAKIGNRVKETTDTDGTGTLDLGGAATGFRAFSDELSSGDTVYYLIVDDPDSPTEYEYGVGTFTAGTPDTLSRDTVHGSSNSDAKVSFSAGTKTVISTALVETFRTIEVTNDGGDVALTIGNTAAGGSTDETVTLAFEHNGAVGGSIKSERTEAYSDAPTQSAALTFHPALNGSEFERMRLSAAGLLEVGNGVGAGNANMTSGITIFQAGADDEIIALKSSDIAHGITDFSETDTFGYLAKYGTSTGGLAMVALSESTTGLLLGSYLGSEDTSDTTGSAAAVFTEAWLKSGTNRTSLGATANVFAVRNGSTGALMLLKGDGTVHAVDTSWATALDVFDDAALLRAIDLHVKDRIPESPLLPSRFDGNRYTIDHLKDLARVVGDADENGARLWAKSRLDAAVRGAIWQNHEMLDALFDTLSAQIPEFNAAIRAAFTARGLPTQILDWDAPVPPGLVVPQLAPPAFNEAA